MLPWRLLHLSIKDRIHGVTENVQLQRKSLVNLWF